MHRVSILRVTLNCVLASLLLLALAPGAGAHRLGESYLFISITESGIEGRVELPPAELELALFADEVSDGVLTAAELDEASPRLERYVAERLGIRSDSVTYRLEFTGHEYFAEKAVPFVRLRFHAPVSGEMPERLTIRYELLFEVDALHRALVLVESNALTGERNQSETVSLIITDSDREQTLELSRPARLDQFLSYVNHGMFHIAIGFDHILFLIALLLAAPLRREARQWRPSPRLRPALVQVISVVTLFTVAHSITLALAALGIVNLPSSLVEAVIALTVVAAAVHNLVPLPGRRFLAIIFVFGLFHGFGFASVLADLGLSRLGLVTSLLGFNIGVELGQLLLVLVAFPALYLVRGWPHYNRAVLAGGSVLIGLFGMYWLLDRTVGLSV